MKDKLLIISIALIVVFTIGGLALNTEEEPTTKVSPPKYFCNYDEDKCYPIIGKGYFDPLNPFWIIDKDGEEERVISSYNFNWWASYTGETQEQQIQKSIIYFNQ